MKIKVWSLVLVCCLLMTVVPVSADAVPGASGGGATGGGTAGGSGGVAGDDYVYLDNISFAEEKLSLEIGDSKTLTVIFEPENATDKGLAWSSSDINVATVDDGVVTAVGCGTAMIRAESSVGFGASCFVDVSISGETGAISWSISGGTTAAEPGELVISGDGAIPDYTMESPAPWSQYCGNVREIYIKEGITGIGDFAFYGCKNVDIISIPETVEEIGDGVFAGITDLWKFEIDSQNSFCYEKDGALYTKDNKTLIFKGLTNSDVYILPDSVTAIAPYAFYMNNMLSRVVLGNQTESIGEGAFAGCREDIAFYYTGTEEEWDEKVQTGANNELLASVVFESKRLSGLTLDTAELELEAGQSTVIGINPIPYDAAIKDVLWTSDNSNVAYVAGGSVVAMNPGVTYIRATSADGGYVAKCKVSVSLKGSLTTGITWEISPDLKTLTVSGSGEIPDYYGTGYTPWEQYRQNLEKIVIGEGITKIGNYGFAETSCKEVVLPSGLLYIGECAFCYSSKLEKINFPSGLLSVGNNAFVSCVKLDSVNLPDSVTYIGPYAFSYCEKLVTLRLPEGIECIENGTFQQCSSLKAVKIPNSVKTVGNYAFWMCTDLETVVVGSGLQYVGNNTSNGWYSVEKVYYNGTSDGWYDISFEYDNDALISANIIYGYEPATKIELDKSEHEMNVRDTMKLSVSFTPRNASMPYVIWSSSDESVAVVDAYGNVTAKAGGTATITARAVGEGNVSASCSISTENVPLTGMVIEETTVNMVKDKEYSLTIVFSPENATNRNINWTSDNEDIVRVSEDGVLLAVGTGTATVTGVTEEGKYTDSVVVTVTETIAQGTLDGGMVWKISYDGNLTVSGTGDMPDFYPGEDDDSNRGTAAGGTTGEDDSGWADTLAPWFEFSEDIISVTVENGITSVGDYAFAYCYKLRNIYIASTVTDIGKNAFENCGAMNIQLPESVVSIGESAFRYNGSLSYIYLPSTLKTIGGKAFEGCWNMGSITLPQGLESIGCNAFSNTGISHIQIPASVKTIDEGAFAKMSNLGSIFVEGAEPSFIVYNGILYNKDMTRLLISPNNATVGYCELPSTVQKIDAGAFSNNYSLNSITLPQGLITIGDEAFWNCNSLNWINVPESVTSIGKYAFSGCGFSYFSVPAGVTEISEGMLSNCMNLNDVYMHDSITKIGNNAFSGCPLINNFRLPKGIKEIGDNAFSSCQISGELELPDGLEKIGDRAFAFCQNLSQVYIPSSVTSIGAAPFAQGSIFKINVDENNTAYTDVDGILYNKQMTALLACPVWKMGILVVPDGVERVENYAFAGSRVSAVMLPDGVTYIGENAFEQCPNLEKIRIPDSVASIGYGAFFNNPMLRSIGLPAAITEIPNSAFSNCSMLETVVFGENVKTVGWDAFYNCSNLKTVKIGSSLEKINHGAFGMVNNLSEIIYEGSSEDWDDIIIEQMNDAIYDAQLTTDAEFVYGVSLDQNSANLKMGDTLELSATISPETLEESLVWNVADVYVANIEDGGVVTAEHAGETAVIVSTVDGCYMDYCRISVSASDSIGENITWSLEDGVLTVSGTGEIPDYDESADGILTETPWAEYGEIIKAIVVGEGITAIGNGAFRGNFNVERITIAQSVKTIGDRAFEMCECVKTINIAKGVESIGDDAFDGMWGLESFTVDADNEYFSALDGVLFSKDKKVLVAYPVSKRDELYKIPAGVEVVNAGAFRGNRYMDSLIMPEGLDTVGEFAFADIMKLNKVIIPSSVNDIGQGLFMGSPVYTIVYGGDAGEYSALVSKTTDNMGLPQGIYIVYNSTMPVNGVMGDPIIEDGVLRAHVWFEALFENCKMIYALYDPENRLVKAEIYDTSNDGAATDEFRAEVENNGLGYTIKVFFWDGLDTMNILGNPLEYYISPTIDVDVILESPHPYENDKTITQSYTSEVGTKIEVTFDELTATEEGMDYIYIYDENDNRIGKFSGTELAGKTVSISGRTVTIKLKADESVSGYGFRTSKIVVYK